jgi:hypothetical protein
MTSSNTPKFFIEKNRQRVREENFSQIDLNNPDTHLATLRRHSKDQLLELEQGVSQRLLKLNQSLQLRNQELSLANQDLLQLLNDSKNKNKELLDLLAELAARAELERAGSTEPCKPRYTARSID